jgi:hypothetical protein
LLRPSFKNTSFAIASVCALVALSACTSSSSSVSLDPPHLRIDSIATAGGSPWTPGGDLDCVQLGSDCPERTLVIDMGPNDKAGHLLSPSKPPVSWTLSPPLTCAGTPPCGFLALTVDSCVTSDAATCSSKTHVAQIVSAGPSIPVAMGDQFPSLGDGGADQSSDGQYFRFHVDLLNPDSTFARDTTGKAYPVEAVV